MLAYISELFFLCLPDFSQYLNLKLEQYQGSDKVTVFKKATEKQTFECGMREKPLQFREPFIWRLMNRDYFSIDFDPFPDNDSDNCGSISFPFFIH